MLSQVARLLVTDGTIYISHGPKNARHTVFYLQESGETFYPPRTSSRHGKLDTKQHIPPSPFLNTAVQQVTYADDVKTDKGHVCYWYSKKKGAPAAAATAAVGDI